MAMSVRLRRRAGGGGGGTAARGREAALPLRPAHGRATRRASIWNYAEPSEGEEEEEEEEEEDDDDDDEEEDTPRRRPKRRRAADAPDNSPSKRRRAGGDDAYLSPSSDGARHGKGRRRHDRPTTPKRHAGGAGGADAVRTPNSAQAPKPARRDQPDQPAQPAQPAQRRPPWATLPYLILSSIFAYGAAPLDHIGSVRWLLGASRTCRAFAEPALRALYESPPLLTMNMAHTLVEHLARDPATTLFDYRAKVKALRIDVGSLASRVYKGRGHLDIARLVALCPRLAHLDLYHYKDLPPYRQQTENLRWTYPAELFAALAATGVRLRSWRWNQRLMGRGLGLEEVRALHADAAGAFAGLRTVRFVNYQRPSLDARDAEDPAAVAADGRQAAALAAALAALPQLQHLALESSTAANELLLPQLPAGLQHLELVNCWDVTTAQFAAYLEAHGRRLRALTLHHNQSLSLGFLPVLGAACPQLAELRMNLTYYSHHAFYNDATPLYDCLLTPDQVPAWPRALRVLELEHLRRWEPAAAEVFFQSLVDSAPRLPQLRVLAIKAMLDVPWRQRCALRDRWEATLDRVFQRRARPPRSEEAWAAAAAAAARAAGERDDRGSTPNKREVPSEPSRRSYRLAAHASLAQASSSSSSTTRGLRRKASGDVSYREPDTDEDMGSDGEGRLDDADDADDAADDHPDDGDDGDDGDDQLQGMCDVVDIRIDNQKPGEIQYRMVDFLDSGDDSNNSDDEWTGDGLEPNDYAW